MDTQNFKNHSKLVPGFHYLTLMPLLLVAIGSLVNYFNATSGNLYSASLIVVLSFMTILVAFFARQFALKAQDRAIKVEQNFRHYIATGQQLDTNLTMPQIIALRFAGDDEFVALAKKAVSENMSAKAIKMAIQHWKGDYYRV